MTDGKNPIQYTITNRSFVRFDVQYFALFLLHTIATCIRRHMSHHERHQIMSLMTLHRARCAHPIKLARRTSIIVALRSFRFIIIIGKTRSRRFRLQPKRGQHVNLCSLPHIQLTQTLLHIGNNLQRFLRISLRQRPQQPHLITFHLLLLAISIPITLPLINGVIQIRKLVLHDINHHAHSIRHIQLQLPKLRPSTQSDRDRNRQQKRRRTRLRHVLFVRVAQ
mmetsp:Transcript_37696/g.60371  ORF Transcript_37696/g.60371 Transcript_37696/m.60371 type:complete len:223 (+) Transcript_37696:92-760(+)